MNKQNTILSNDLERIYTHLTEIERKKLNDSTILITGCGGFLGYYFVNFFTKYADELGIQKIIGIDNFIVGCPPWLKEMECKKKIDLHEFDIITDDISTIENVSNVTHVLHMASIASPTFYRAHPIETLDANVWGLRRLLEYYKSKLLNGFLFFSSSEIYGNSTPENIPTPEEYNGNVSCIGPRACYDEAKRFGETICYLFHEKYGTPITVVRPFNNYGPGMRLNDKRVPADFAKAIFENRDITLLSDGTPTRTFCYISDAITGYIKALLYDDFEIFNIGTETPEISILKLAETYQKIGGEVFGYTGKITHIVSEDANYLVNNPNRRCPNIGKARSKLSYNPQINVDQGVRYFLQFIKENRSDELEW